MGRIMVDFDESQNLIFELGDALEILYQERYSIKKTISELDDLENYYLKAQYSKEDLYSCMGKVDRDIIKLEDFLNQFRRYVKNIEDLDGRLAEKFKTDSKEYCKSNEIKMNSEIELDKFQAKLDAIGLIPGIGDVLDCVNALISVARGNYGDAITSAMGMFSIFGGDLVKGLKYTDEASVLLKHGADVVDLKKTEIKKGIKKSMTDFEKEVVEMNTKSDIGNNKKPNKGANKPESIPKRPSWRQSELDVESEFPDYNPQKSFIDGKEVPYGTKGSSRPDCYKKGASIEVKNYKITTTEGRSRLINNISKQVNKRITDLPDGTIQTVIVDVRGQDVSNDILKSIRDKILEKSNTNVNIQFKR